MQEKKNINLKKFHKREIQSNYLVIKSEQKFDFNDFEYKILENNNIEGLLKLKIDDESLLFDITSKQPLSLILEYKKVNQKDIKTLIFELNKVISSLSQYLLEESSLLIDMDCIYANPKDLSLEFCYIPRFSNDLGVGISHILSGLLSYIDHNDHEAVVLGYSLFQESQKEGYVLGDLLNIISMSDIGANKVIVKKDKNKDNENKDSENKDNEIKDFDVKANSTLEPTENKESKQNKKSKIKNFSIVELFKGRKEKTKIEEEESTEDENEVTQEWLEYFENYDTKEDTEEYKHTQLLIREETEDTNKPILKALNKVEKDIELSYFPFIVGTQDRVCDYVLMSENVSRMHAKFDKKDSKIFVKDLNSLNGTRVNKENIIGNEEKEIFNNDEVEIADIIFRLKI